VGEIWIRRWTPASEEAEKTAGSEGRTNALENADAARIENGMRERIFVVVVKLVVVLRECCM
jgi:hypothetical protein